MRDHKNVEAELLLDVQQKGAAFEDAHNRCRKQPIGKLQQCLKSFARDYGQALNAFSEFILEGRCGDKPRPWVLKCRATKPGTQCCMPSAAGAHLRRRPVL